MAPLVRAGSLLGGALAGNRPLGREDRTVLGTLSVAILSSPRWRRSSRRWWGGPSRVVAFWFGVGDGDPGLGAGAPGATPKNDEGALLNRALEQNDEEDHHVNE